MSKYSKRHFTVVIQNKEHGLYISSTPSSAAKKAVSKLCASNKKKKVEFHIREITRDSKKKTYGPYIGYLEKLKIPIKLKEYIIKYNPVAKLKKSEMRGGTLGINDSENTLNSENTLKSEITLNDYSDMIEHMLLSEDIKKNLRYLNKALTFIGINRCLNFFANFLSNFDDKLPIISVGSGTAYFEFLINTIFQREIICVDPDPTSYTPAPLRNNTKIPNTVFIPPKFHTVNDLLPKNKYKDCLLLLNWPNPMRKEDTIYNPYDFNAIIKLKPIGFFIVYEITNCSGSDDLTTVLNGSNNVANFTISEEEKISYKLLKDIQEKETPKVKVILEFRNDILDYRIAFYRRTN
jgi:hypothetical protein